jgi:hypothetical protein
VGGVGIDALSWSLSALSFFKNGCVDMVNGPLVNI